MKPARPGAPAISAAPAAIAEGSEAANGASVRTQPRQARRHPITPATEHDHVDIQ